MTITIYFKSDNIQIDNLPSSLEDLKTHIQNTLQNKLPKTWDLYHLNDQGHNIPISNDIEYAKTLELENSQNPPGLNLFVLPIKIEHHEEHKVSFERREVPCTDEEYQARRDQGQGQEEDLSRKSSISSVSSFSSMSVSVVSQINKEEEKTEVRYEHPVQAPYQQERVPRDPKAENLREYFVDTKKGLKDLKHRYKEIIKLAQRGNREALYKCDELFFALPEGTIEVLKASLKVPFKDFQEDLKKEIEAVLPVENEELGMIAQGKKKVEGWVKLNQMKVEFRTKLREIKRNFREIKREEKQKDKKLKKLEKRGSINNEEKESLQQKIQKNSQRIFTSLSMKVSSKWSS